jgi:methylphosphotriester-DNA--protein-cysteine methyltransferase
MSRKNVPALTLTEQDSRWIQVKKRDKSADGLFWYSVASTGVFCRPSCPSLDGLITRCDREENAIYRYNRASTRKWQDNRGDRPGRRRYGASTIGTHQSRLGCSSISHT